MKVRQKTSGGPRSKVELTTDDCGCCAAQRSLDRSERCAFCATLFDRWIRALLAFTRLKAHAHVTSGLALAQLKGGGG